MSIFNLDRQTLLNGIANFMILLFCLNLIMLVLAINLRREGKENLRLNTFVQISLLIIGMISILISFGYWCILK